MAEAMFLFLSTHEFLYDTALIAICSTFEVGLGVTAAIVTTSRPLSRAWMSGRRSKREVPGRNIPLGQSNIHWVMSLNIGNEEQKAIHAHAASVAWGPDDSCNTVKSNDTMKTFVTGRESINGMPGLVFARMADEEVGTFPDDTALSYLSSCQCSALMIFNS